MKKIMILFLCTVMLALASCSSTKPNAPEKATQTDTNGTETTQTGTGAFMVGYGRTNITPKVSVGLTGYGNASTRVSDNILSYLYLTCLAVTDSNGNTVLLYGVDATTSDIDVTNTLRNKVSKETGIPGENIMISATHTHSAPEITDPYFQSLLMEGAVIAAKDALADRSAASVEAGTVTTESLNFVRHYILEDGTYKGDNYNSGSLSPIVGHTTEADRDMQLIRFCRETKDIVLMNFQVHPTLTGGASKYDISADLVGACRETMEKELNCNFLYFTGAAGNLNAVSKISEENVEKIDYRVHGRRLAQYAIDAMDTLDPVEMGNVRVLNQTFRAENSYNEDGNLIEYVPIVYSAYNAGGVSAAQKAGEPYGIHSIYHARAISRRANVSAGSYTDIPVSTVSIGDVAFVIAPYEMFDAQGIQIKNGSPYEMTFVLTCANAGYSYIAPEYAFDHGCYEADMRVFARGTAEQLADNYITMLNTMMED